MAIQIKFDSAGNPESPTFILAHRNGEKIGQISATSVSVHDALNDANEVSFTVHQTINGTQDPLWKELRDFRLVYCREWDQWFEMTVEISEAEETTKICLCKQLGQAELSQILLHGIEINTELDIAREQYKKPTVLFDQNCAEASLLHRIMEKAPHYSVIHVDASIARIQRTFTFDGTSIYDAFQQIAEEIGCLFVLHSDSDENGFPRRVISVYDLQSNCNSCGNRGEFSERCPKCGSEDLTDSYGEDTTIFVTADALGDDIQFTSDTDATKNCFKLEAGDDLMTATVRNCNPNGTDYIWHFSEKMKSDMPETLRQKINEYDEAYTYYQTKYPVNLSASALANYNALVQKYKVYNKTLEEISTPVKGFPALMQAYYNTIDFSHYLETSLMPPVDLKSTTAADQIKLLTPGNLSPVAVENIKDLSITTADSAVLAMAKCVADSSRFEIKIKSSSISTSAVPVWSGCFTVTSISDETDTATSNTVTIQINESYEEFVKQKIKKTLAKGKVEDVSVVGLFQKEIAKFTEELKKYSLSRLNHFYDCCKSCIDILIEQGISDKKTWSGATPNLYDDLYLPYCQKMEALEAEIKVREQEVWSITGQLDKETNRPIKGGLQTVIHECVLEIQNKLNFESFLGKSLWLEFCAYRREDTFSNSNYVSDGLNNAELFNKALEFVRVASNEIYKSCELQHSISASLKNLLVIDRFAPLVEHFAVGNWLRIQVDHQVYKLRLIEYEIDYDSLEEISVTFSDVIKGGGNASDIASILAQSSAMATSYDYVQRQASQGANSNGILQSWFTDGLNATHTKIIGGSDNQTQTWDSHGMLFRKYSDISDTYDDVQIKIINSTLAITDDNWKTTKTAIGNFIYRDPTSGKYLSAYGVNGEVVVGQMILGQSLGIYNASGSLRFDGDGLTVSNNTNTITINPNGNSLVDIQNKTGSIFSLNQKGNLHVVGEIEATALTLIGDATSGDTPSPGVDGFHVSNSGLLKASNAIIYGTIFADKGAIGGWEIGRSCISRSANETSDSEEYAEQIAQEDAKYGTENTYYFGKKGLSITDKFKVSNKGRVSATSGEIGGWTISTYRIERDDVKVDKNENWVSGYRSGMQAYSENGTGSYSAFYAGCKTTAGKTIVGNSNFYVKQSGELFAQTAVIQELLCEYGNLNYTMLTISNNGNVSINPDRRGDVYIRAASNGYINFGDGTNTIKGIKLNGQVLSFSSGSGDTITSTNQLTQNYITSSGTYGSGSRLIIFKGINSGGFTGATAEYVQSYCQDYTADYSAKKSHTHKTSVITPSYTSSTIATDDLIDFSGVTSNTKRAATPTYVQTYYNNKTSSDQRLKENIILSSTHSLETINKMRLCAFDWKDEMRGGIHWDVGVIADELEQLDSRFISRPLSDDEAVLEYKSVDTWYLTGHILKAIQELSAQVATLEKRVKQLECAKS